MAKYRQQLGAFALTMISVSAILNLRSFQIMANQGLHALFFLLVGALCFLLPSALVCAELASQYPEDGGIYYWVKRAFGQKVGFVAIWMEWINNVIAFPATISAIVMTFMLALWPHARHNSTLMFSSVMVILWGATLYNSFGIKPSSRLNIVGALLGTLLPGALVIVLGFGLWAWHGFPVHHWLTQPILPAFNQDNLAVLVAAMSGFSGMQITAFHAKNVKSPQTVFPKAILLTTLIVVLLSVLGTFSIALIVPPAHVNLLAGIMQTFTTVLSQWHLFYLSDVIACLIGLGMISSLSAWVLGPARGLHAAMQDFKVKPLTALNRFDMPTPILILQGIVGTLMALIFILAPSLKLAFWILIALTSQFTVLMYVLVFSSAIKLRKQHKTRAEGFLIPGKNVGLISITSLGIIACLLGFWLGLYPPSHLEHLAHYGLWLLLGDIIIIVLPLLFLLRFRKTHPKTLT